MQKVGFVGRCCAVPVATPSHVCPFSDQERFCVKSRCWSPALATGRLSGPLWSTGPRGPRRPGAEGTTCHAGAPTHLGQ